MLKATWIFAVFVISRHGQGIYHYQETGSKFKGTWVNGKMESAGEYLHTNHRFMGNFINNYVSFIFMCMVWKVTIAKMIIMIFVITVKLCVICHHYSLFLVT